LERFWRLPAAENALTHGAAACNELSYRCEAGGGWGAAPRPSPRGRDLPREKAPRNVWRRVIMANSQIIYEPATLWLRYLE